MNEREQILAELEPLIVEAERTGKWIWCHYQDLWFSPKQFRAQHAKGSFIWGPVNWKLRDPGERVNEANDRASRANAEAARIARDVKAETAQ